MDQEYSKILEQSRKDKVKTLGFRCYNLYIDGVVTIPEIKQTADEIKTVMDYLVILRHGEGNISYKKMYEDRLDEKLEELGYICYNLCIDNKISNAELSLLCKSISSINDNIKNDSVQNPVESVKKIDLLEYKYTAEDRFENNYYDEMEPIPSEFKICSCGYKNRTEAIFCAKCGRKILGGTKWN